MGNYHLTVVTADLRCVTPPATARGRVPVLADIGIGRDARCRRNVICERKDTDRFGQTVTVCSAGRGPGAPGCAGRVRLGLPSMQRGLRRPGGAGQEGAARRPPARLHASVGLAGCTTQIKDSYAWCEDALHRAGQSLENGYCESFDSKLRDELLNGEIFTTLREARGADRELATALQCREATLLARYQPPAPEAILPPARGLAHATLRSVHGLAKAARL